MNDTAAVSSMTGFARVEGRASGYAWAVEARSVNGRSLEIRNRLPSNVDGLDALAREEIAARFKRGNVALNASFEREEGAPSLRINRMVLDQVLTLARELQELGAAAPSVDSLLAVRGVVEISDAEDEDARLAAVEGLQSSLRDALDRLAVARREEGARLTAALTSHLDEIAALTVAAAGCAAAQPDALRTRLQAQVRALLDAAPALPEERLAQEAALLAARADVREELDRLRAHIAAARELIGEGGVIGRRLDFLCQEFNREANTLCSKASDIELTRIGIDLKAVIEQMREQVQNIE